MTKKIGCRSHSKIWQRSDGRWCTYIEGDQKHKRRLIVKTNLEDLEAFLKADSTRIVPKEVRTFGMLFEGWNDRRLEMEQISPATHYRMTSDYSRFFRESLGNVRVDKVDAMFYVDVLEQNVPKFRMGGKAISRCLGLVKGVLNYAKRLGYISYSGNEVVEEYRALGVRSYKTHHEDYEEIYTDAEMEAVMQYLEENPCDVNNAIYLIFITGLRVGECVSLKHSDFDGNTIQIRRTETSWKEGGFFYRTVKDSPKTAAGYRTVFVPSSYDWFMELLRRQNFAEEWVFLGADRKMLSQNFVQRRLRQICLKLGIYPKSPHKIRKTYCSILLDNRIDNGFIKQQVGHADISVTENYYHRNRRNSAQKMSIIDSVPELNVNQKVAERTQKSD